MELHDLQVVLALQLQHRTTNVSRFNMHRQPLHRTNDPGRLLENVRHKGDRFLP